MKRENHRDEERREGQVHQSDEGGRPEEPLDRFKLAAGGWRARLRIAAFDVAAEHDRIQRRLEPCAIPRQKACSSEIQKPHQTIEREHEDQQRDQPFLRTRPQNTVIDLKHEEGAGQHQQVRENAEEKGESEEMPVLSQNVCGDVTGWNGCSPLDGAIKRESG